MKRGMIVVFIRGRGRAFVRVLIPVLIGLLLVVGWRSPFSTAAQGDDCAGLDADSCALLRESAAVMAAVRAAHFEVDLALSLEYFLLPEPITLRMLLGGSYTLDESDATDEVLALLDQLTAQMNVILEIPAFDGVPLLPPAFENLVTFDLRLVDGIGYLNLDKIAERDTTGQVQGGWYSVDLVTLYTDLLAEVDPQAQPLPLEENLLTEFDLTFAQVERLADVEQGGLALAVFQQNLDASVLLADPTLRKDFTDFIVMMLRDTYGFGLSYTDAELEEAAARYTTLFEGVRLSLTQTINPENAYLVGVEFTVTFEPDSTALIDLTTGPDPLGAAALIYDIRFDMALALSRFQEVQPVPAPPDAVVVPLDEMLPGILPGTGPDL